MQRIRLVAALVAAFLVTAPLGAEERNRAWVRASAAMVQEVGWFCDGAVCLGSGSSQDVYLVSDGVRIVKIAPTGAVTFPSGTITLPAAVPLAQGGTGLSSYAAGDLVYFATGTTFTKLAIGATEGMFLRKTGSAAPGWSTLVLPNSAAQGDLVVATGANTWGAVTAAAAGKVLQAGGASTVPAYSTATYPATATGTGAYLRADGTNWIQSTLLLPNSGTQGDLVVATASNTWGAVAAAAAGKVLRAGGAGTVPAYSTATYPDTAATTGAYLRADGTNWITSTLVLPNAATSTRVVYASAANTYGESANLTFDGTTLTGASLQYGASGLKATALVASPTAPTIAAGFCTSPSISANNGTIAFTITIGTGCGAATGSVTLPEAAGGWVCYVQNVTAPDSNVIGQTGGTTTTATFTNYARTTGLAANWTDSQVLRVLCAAY